LYILFQHQAEVGGLPTVTFSSDTQTVKESYSEKVNVGEVTISQYVSKRASVDYSIISGTAGEADVVLGSGILTFGPCNVSDDEDSLEAIQSCNTTATVTAQLKNDDVPEPEEYFTVTLKNPKHLTLGANPTVTVKIINDDYPSIFFPRSTGNISESYREAFIPVQMNYPAQQKVYVSYKAAGGTAKGKNIDYSWSEGSLTFEQGYEEARFRIKVNNNTICEADKTVILKLYGGSGGIVSKEAVKDTFTLTILDDDCK